MRVRVGLGLRFDEGNGEGKVKVRLWVLLGLGDDKHDNNNGVICRSILYYLVNFSIFYFISISIFFQFHFHFQLSFYPIFFQFNSHFQFSCSFSFLGPRGTRAPVQTARAVVAPSESNECPKNCYCNSGAVK